MNPVAYPHAMIKLTFLVRSLDYGGAQRQLVTLVRALDKTRFEVSVLTFYSGQPLEKELDGTGVRIVSLNKRGRWDLLPFLVRLLRQAKLLHPDILHGYLDIPNVLALLLKPFTRAQVVWGLRASGIELRNYNWLLRWAARLERWLARFADLIIVNSNAAREHHLARGLPAARLVMIPNGIDSEMFKHDSAARTRLRRELSIVENTRLIGTVGRIDPVKDLSLFLQAAALVCQQTTEVRFICVGTGRTEYAQELKNFAVDSGLGDRIVWLPAQDDVAGIYSALDLLVSSSRSESFPNTVAEAMACGIPCVVTDVGDSALIVGDCGIVVPPNDPTALAAGMMRSLNAVQSNSNSRARIVEDFSAQRLAQRTAAALSSLAKR